MKDLTPKQWMKKYCRKGFVICDGSVDAFNPLELIQTIIILGGVAGIGHYAVSIIKSKVF